MEFERNTKPIVLPWRQPDPLSPPLNQVKAAFGDTYLNHLEELHLDSPTRNINLTNIIATVGERNSTVDNIKAMIKSGMSIARVPTHSITLNQVESIIKNIKKAIEEISLEQCIIVTCAIAVETQGAQIRLGKLVRPDNVNQDETYFVQLQQGQTFILTGDPQFQNKGTSHRMFVDNLEIPKRCHIGDIIYLNGRDIHLEVKRKEYNDVHCVVTKSGLIYGNELVCVLNVTFNIPILSSQDGKLIDLVVKESVDMIIASSIRNADTIRQIRNLLKEHSKRVIVIPKIETLLSLEYIDDIIEESYVIFIDRKNLTAAAGIHKTFLAHKIISAKCNKMGKSFVIGKLILEKDIKNINNVRNSELSDVTHIAEHGADAIVISQSENSSNQIELFKELLKLSESVLWERHIFNELNDMSKPPLDPAHSIAISCVEVSFKCQAVAIIVVTCSGYSAKLVSRYRPQCPIFAVSTYGYVCRQLNIYRNIKPLHYIKDPQDDWSKDVDCRVQFAIQYGLDNDIIQPGDPLVIINGWKKGAGFTNVMRVVYAPLNDGL